MSGGFAVVQALRDGGVDLVFGIPGTHNLEIYRYLTASGISHVAPRHEQGGGYAADGYARATGRPGVLITTSGPGLTNACTPAATAYADSIPLLLISPGPPRGLERADVGLLHEMKDQHAHLDCLVDRSVRVSSPLQAYLEITSTLTTWPYRRQRPVHVEVPVDVLEEPIDPAILVATECDQRAPQPDDAELARAVDALSHADDIVIVAGGGSRQASAQVRALAEQLAAPVLTTVNGKGVLPEQHPLSLGASLRLPHARQAADRAGVLLLVGTELGDSDLWGGKLVPSGTVIRIDIAATQLHKNVAAHIALLGDAAAVLTELSGRIGARTPAASPARVAGVRRDIDATAYRDGAAWQPFHDALRGVLPQDTIIAGDSAQVSYFGTIHQWPATTPGQFLYPTGFATLGYGIPAAIGAKLGRPDQPVIALVGDGGTMFTVQEFMTAVDLHLPLPVIVMNNGGYGEIRDEMVDRGIEPLAVGLRSPDFPALARAFGGRGTRAHTPQDLASATRDALESTVPTLIEVPVAR